MSKHHISHAFDNVMRDVRTMTTPELEEHYGVEVGEDGKITDVCSQRVFKNTTEWAIFAADEEDAADRMPFERCRGRSYFDDE